MTEPLSDRMLELLGRPDGPLADASLWHLEVVAARELTPTMRRLELTAAELGDLRYEPGQDLMFRIRLADGSIGNRRYTIRSLDREHGVVTCDVVLHGHGPGAQWAASAQPGDGIDAIGPRGDIALDASARWHWFCADESGLPAVLTMIEALPGGTSALALVDVTGADEQQPFERTPDAEAEVVWLHRGNTPAGTSTLVADALAVRSLPDGDGHAYLAAEAKQVRAWRTQLLELGLPKERISGKSYWALGRADGERGRPKRGRD